MTPYELIKAKRDGRAIDPQRLADFVRAHARGELPDYQMSAMLMAIFFRGLTPDELAAWADAMLRSGDVLDLSDIPGAKVDKHSTGGVGDKVSLCLAPLVAACGVRVPMISGRGLGHTGGTLDKLEAIPGFRVDVEEGEYKRLVRELGLCLIGQTARIAPADRRLYALRDVTATVDCVPLIASSILSKKLAEGIDALVLDVKVGSGAFMKTLDQARVLARTLIDLSRSMGKPAVAYLTRMDEPLGRAVGNTLEVYEALDVLEGQGPADVTELTLALGAEMLVQGKAVETTEEARSRLRTSIEDGSARAKWLALVAAQGGDPAALAERRLRAAAHRAEVLSPRDGYVSTIETEELGLVAVGLGAGRRRTSDPVNPAVGLVLEKKRGDFVRKGEPLATLHVDERGALPDALGRVTSAFTLTPAPPAPTPLVLERLA